MSIRPAQVHDRNALVERGSPVPNASSSSPTQAMSSSSDMDDSEVSMSLDSDQSGMEMTTTWNMRGIQEQEQEQEQELELYDHQDFKDESAGEESVDMELTGRFSVVNDSTARDTSMLLNTSHVSSINMSTSPHKPHASPEKHGIAPPHKSVVSPLKTLPSPYNPFSISHQSILSAKQPDASPSKSRPALNAPRASSLKSLSPPPIAPRSPLSKTRPSLGTPQVSFNKSSASPRKPRSSMGSDTTQTMDLTMAFSPASDASESSDTTLDSDAERSAMEMTEMWGRFAEDATRKREAAEAAAAAAEAAAAAAAAKAMTAATVAAPPPVVSVPRSPSPTSPKRSPVRRQTMFLSPDRSARTGSAGSTPKAEKRAASIPPAWESMPSTPSTPTRFRQSLRGGVPSPSYQHSPPRRALTTPPIGSPARSAATDRDMSPTPLSPPIRGAAQFRMSDAYSQQAAWPRSPFIHSLLRQRGGRMSQSNVSPRSDGDLTDRDEETSFHMQLADFLSVIGLKFHEDMTASRTHAERPREAAAAGGTMHPTTALQYAKMAGAAAPMLQALRNACQELKQHVEDGRVRLHAMEQDFYARPPAFVQEWGQLEDDDMRRSMKGQLNVHKQAARAAAMHDYYGWRTDMQYDDDMVLALAQHRDALRADQERVLGKRATLEDELLPTLRERHAELKQRVDEARARQEAIRQCDPEELKQLHASIDEQDHVLQTMRAKQRDVADQLARVRSRVDESYAKREQTEELIRAARVVSDQIHGCTPGEAVRLGRRIRQLETLLQWSLTNKTSTLLQLVFARTLNVAIELDGRRGGHSGTVKRVAISPARPVEASPMHMAAICVIRSHLEAHTPACVPDVLRTTARLWHVYLQARAQVDRLRLHVPVLVTPSRDDVHDTALDVVAPVLLEHAQAKVHVHVDMDLALTSPITPEHVHVELVYGHMDVNTMTHMIRSALIKDPRSPNALVYAITNAQTVMDA